MIQVHVIHAISQLFLETIKNGLLKKQEIILYYEKAFDDSNLLDFELFDNGEITKGSIGKPESCISCVSRSHAYDTICDLESKYGAGEIVVIFPAFVEPRAIADYFVIMEDDRESIIMDIHTVSTAVDCMNFLRDVTVEKLGEEMAKSEFLYRSIEYSDSVFLANHNRISSESLEGVKEVLGQINSMVELLDLSDDGTLHAALSELPIFNFEHPTRFSPLTSESQITPYVGARSERIVWSAITPMHPERFAKFIDENLEFIFRSRGNLWFANCVQNQIGWESFANVFSMDRLDTWEAIDISAENYLVLLIQSSSKSKEVILAELESCLFTTSELTSDPSTWIQLPDPLYEAIQQRQESGE
jgi:G3E family GTPase